MSPTAVKQRQQSAVTPEELQKAVRAEKERRAVLKEFVAAELQQGVDYGQIDIRGRASKPTLFKPGMEKIFSLFSIVSTLEKDEETLTMITVRDIVAYKCKLYRGGEFLGEGRGACAVGEKARVNDAIKIAEKRARMDACLNLGFSEYFTQDLEDWDKDQPVQSASVAPRPQARPIEEVELIFHVEGKDERTSKSGNPYAELATSEGRAIAFSTSMEAFAVGGVYSAKGYWEERGGRSAFIVTAPAAEVTEVA